MADLMTNIFTSNKKRLNKQDSHKKKTRWQNQSNTRELLSEVSDALILTHILTLKDQSDTANTSSEPSEQTADRTD